MQNLNLNKIQNCPLPEYITKTKQFSRVENSNVLSILSNTQSYIFNYLDNNILEILKELPDKNIEHIQWNDENDVLYMVTENSILWYNTSTFENGEIDLEMQFDTYAWNYTREFIVFVNRTGLIKIMILDATTNSYNIFVEHQLNLKQLKVERKDVDPEKKEFDKPVVQWNRKGTHFAVNFDIGHRIICIFTTACELVAQNEYFPNLCPEITWDSDGDTVACIQKNEDNYSILFFERNGLFLPRTLTLLVNLPVVQIQWNVSGDILTVLHQNEAKTTSYVTLYFRFNNYWYAKQNLLFDKEIANYVNWMEDSELRHMQLEVLTNRYLITYNYNWQVDSINYNNENLLTTIDGNRLQISFLNNNILPPPTCNLTIKFNNCINFVRFSYDAKFMLVILDDSTGIVYRNSKNCFEKSYIFDTYSLLYNGIALNVNNYVIANENDIYACQTQNMESALFKVGKDNLFLKNFEKEIFYISYLEKNDSLQLFIDNETVVEYSLKEQRVIKSENNKIPNGNITIAKIQEENNYLTICQAGLELYTTDQMLYLDVTSYLVTNNYLFLTTTDSQLLCYKLTKLGVNRLKNLSYEKVTKREIPKGSILIASVPNTHSIILQLPRGDIEIIRPRILTIDAFQMLLNNKNYKQAFNLIREDRINPNIIVDVNPENFLENIKNVIENIDMDLLNSFIIDIEDENITEKMYNDCFEQLPKTLENKKITVLNAIIKTMKEIDTYKFLHPIVTAYVCLGTEEAIIDSLKVLSFGYSKNKNDTRIIDMILNRISNQIHVEKLFNCALVIQDYDLIQLIGSKTQKDPLEYIPFLTELQKMDDNYRNYKIYYHVKRYNDAFLALLNCNNVEKELTEIILKCNLTKYVLKNLKASSQYFSLLMPLCATKLVQDKNYYEAACIYLRLKKYNEALEYFIEANSMNDVENIILLLLQKGEIEKKHANIFYTTLCENLIRVNKIKEAAYLYEYRLNYYEKGILILMENNFWMDAQNMIYRNIRFDFLETDFKTSLIKYVIELNETLKKKKEQFVGYKERLAKVRQGKIDYLISLERNKLGNYEGDEISVLEDVFARDDLQSLFSVTTVGTSRITTSTALTSQSSRRKKKMERKVMNLQEGNQYENIALVRQLHILIVEVQNYANTIKEVCHCVFHLENTYEYAVNIYETYSKFIECIKNSLEDIWPQEMKTPTDNNDFYSLVCRYNIEHLDFQYHYPPSILPSSTWKIDSLGF